MSKKLQILFTTLIIFTCTGLTQTFYTVDNRSGLPANYRTLQGALDSVPAGSILLLQASGIDYGYGIVRKPIAIYGAGYFLGQNADPNTQARTSQSMVAQLSFVKGSQGSTASGLSFVLNPTFDGAINQRIICDSTSNITVSRCYFDYVPFAGFTHNRIFLLVNSSIITITQSYINAQEYILVPIKTTSITFSNNIFIGSALISMISNASAPYNYTFSNNSIYASMESMDFSGGSFFNNVIIQNNTAVTVSVTSPMTIASHNVSNINLFPFGSTNIINADGPNTYAGTSNPAVISQDGIWQLKTGSVAIGYGSDNLNCGAYGGIKPYVLSGIPAIPNFYFADPQPVGTGVGGLNIHFRIKANN